MESRKIIKVILFSMAGLLILSATIAILILTQPEEPVEVPDEIVEPEVKATVFADFEIEAVKSIHVTNQKDDGYTVVSNELTAGYNYLILELEERSDNVPYNQDSLRSMVQAITRFSSRSTVEENTKGLEKYGLVSPVATVEVEFTQKRSLVFFVGDPTPDGMTHYLRVKGDDAVYAIESYKITPFFNERHDWVHTLAFPQYSTSDAPTISRVEINRPDIEDDPIVIEAIPSMALEELRTFNSHKLVSPVNVEVHPEKSASVIFGLFGLSATNVLWVAPDEVDFELSGLSTPQCVVEVVAGDDVYTLTIGDSYQGGYYGISSHVPELLFLFSEASLPWLSVTAEDLVSDVFLTPYIFSLDKLIIEIEDDAHEFATLEFTIIGDDDDNTVFFNGNPLSANERDKFGELYQYLISARGETLFMTETPDAKTVVKITFVYRDVNRGQDVVEYLAGNNRRSIIRINGDNIFTCRDIYTTRLLQNIQAFTDGENPIVLDW